MSEPKIIRLDNSILEHLPPRKNDAHKGTYGKVLIIAGSEGMSGAAFLSALSAYRAGAGLVKILSPEENRIILQTALPEALISCYNSKLIDEERQEFSDFIEKELSWASVIVIGPGLSTEPYVKVLVEEVLSKAYVPLIVDADAINIISKYPYLQKYLTENTILTPHIKEMERLCGLSTDIIKSDMLGTAKDYYESHGVTLVLKSAKTVIVSKDVSYVNDIPAPALAKAGSGDILSGIMAAILCFCEDDGICLAMAVYIHNLAARLAARKISEHGTIARDIIACIPAAMEYNRKKGV